MRSFIHEVRQLFVSFKFKIVTFALKDLHFHWRLRHNFPR